MEAQFESLSLEYLSPEARESMRHSLRDSLLPSTRASRLSGASRASVEQDDSQLLRF